MPILRDLLHSVSLPAWTSLLRAHGVRPLPKSLADVRARLDDAAGDLLADVRTLRILGHDALRPLIVEAARVLAAPPVDASHTLGTAELVVLNMTRAVRDDAWAEVLQAAKHRVCRREPRALGRRYLGRAAVAAMPPKVTPAATKAMAAVLERAGDARDAVGEVEIAVLPSRDVSAVTLEVVRPDPLASRLVRGARGKVEVLQFVPMEVDCIVVAPGPDGVPILWVWTDAPELLPAYRIAVGKALFGDPTLFANAASLSFRELARRRGQALDVKHARTARLKKARVVKIRWDSGLEETIAISGRNVLAAMERDDLFNHGRIVEAIIRLDFDDGPVDVTLRSPNVVHWEACAHNDAIRAFLDGLGLDEPVHYDIVTLAPHDHPAWHWREAVGDTVFEWLRANEVFEASSSRALAHPDHAAAGRISLAFELTARGSGRHYAVPEEGFDVGSRLVSDVDLVTYKLDVRKLGALVARGVGAAALDANGPPSERGGTLERGMLVDLGEVVLENVTTRWFLMVAPGSTKGLAGRLRALCGGAHPVIVTPPGHRLDSGCVEVALASLMGPYTHLRDDVARALGIKRVPTIAARAPRGTRIAVDRASGRVEIDGVEMSLMAASTLVLVRTLVEADGAPVPGVHCDERIAPRRTDGGAAKAAKLRFVPGATASFQSRGKEPPEDLAAMIEGTRAGYRITVKCWIG